MERVMAKDKYSHLRMLFASAGSRIFTVRFVKADQTLRVMKVQLAIGRKHLSSREEKLESVKLESIRKRAEQNPNLFNVWDIEKNGWRSINLDTVQEVHLNGKVYAVQDLEPVLQK
jgi:hypothetical protein